MTRYLIAGAAALAVMAGWSAVQQQRGVERERARVDKIGEATHVRAKTARKKVEAKPPEKVREDLRRFCVDCD